MVHPVVAARPLAHGRARRGRAISKIVARHGSAGCRVTGEIVARSGMEFIQTRNVGERNCLVTKGATHDSNHAYLVETGGFYEYGCHAAGCRGKSHQLGMLPRVTKSVAISQQC